MEFDIVDGVILYKNYKDSILISLKINKFLSVPAGCCPVLSQQLHECSSCKQVFTHKRHLNRHQRFYCKSHGTETNPNPYRTRLSNLPIHQKGTEEIIVVKPRKRQKLIEEKVTFPSKEVYMVMLGLLPHFKAAKLQQQSMTKDVTNCNVLELGDENIPPSAPTTPHSKRSLISLFRESSPLGHHQQKCKRACVPKKEIMVDVDEDENESVSSSSNCGEDGHDDDGEDNYKPRRVMSLLNIDITSLLGNRVRKHINSHYDNIESSPMLRRSNYECYCRTPIKTRDVGRLRNRGQEFQVTFRKTKHTAPKHYHQYKFSRAQLREFCSLLETGLNRQSRALRKHMRKCKVVLQPLSEKDISKWGPQSRSTKECTGEVGSSKFPGFALVKSESNKLLFPSQLGFDISHAIRGNSLDVASSKSSDGSSDRSELDDEIIILDELEPTTVKQTENVVTPSSHRQRRKSPVIPRRWIDDGDSKFDDVISISSSDSEDDLKVVSSSISKDLATARATTSRINQKTKQLLHPSALLFKCHICSEEIICAENANIFIKQHFADCHDVHNIELVEHLDASGQKVFSIIDTSSSTKQMNAGKRTGGKRLRSPLASRDVCNEINLPSDEIKKSKSHGKTKVKNCTKNNRKRINMTAMDRLKGSNVVEGNKKTRAKTKSSASKNKTVSPGLMKSGKLCSSNFSAKNHIEALSPQRTAKKGKSKATLVSAKGRSMRHS